MRPPQSITTASAGNRVVGAAAIAFAVLWVIENVLFMVTGAVPYDAPIEDVVAYYANNRDAVAVISGLVALYLPLLLGRVAKGSCRGDSLVVCFVIP